ncbi:MAG: DUF5658 family protein [Dehalococcoidia bacterium]|nr:DUF5658 family protein [Dehalococcoidia bacterium]
MKCLLAALTILVIADGIVTQFLVGRGFAREGNPFMEPLVGENFFLLVKIVGAAVCAYLLWDIYKRWAKLALISTSCLVVCYGAIVTWNVSTYFIAN